MPSPTHPPESAPPSPPDPPRQRWIWAVVAVLALLSLVQSTAMWQTGALHGNDFKHLWAGAYLLAHERTPYDADQLKRVRDYHAMGSINPYVYLPTTGLLMRPLAALSPDQAKLAWFTFNWLLAWITVLLGPRWLRVERPELAALVGAVFITGAFPFFRQMTAGQLNVALAALIVLAAGALVRRRAWLVGLALAAGFALKISPLFLIAALAGLRRWRAFALALADSVVLLLLSLILYGAPIHRQALAMIGRMGYGHSTWQAEGMDFYRDPFNQSINSLMHHLWTDNPYTSPWATFGSEAANRLTLLCSLLILVALGWAFYRSWQKTRVDVDPQTCAAWTTQCFLAAALAMLLLPSLMWDHYAVQALPALLWLGGDRRTVAHPARTTLFLLIVMLLAIPWRPHTAFYQAGAPILLMSLKLWPTLALYAWLLADRPAALTHK